MDTYGRRRSGKYVGDERGGIVGGRDTYRSAVGPGAPSVQGPTGGPCGSGAVAARPTVIVVGAGVSGCACAAALATAGLHVTLVNSAMDRVGLPAYGPDLVGEDGDWSRLLEALESLPSLLREVWVGAAARPASGGAILNIDRRRISIETKRALERIPGLDFRQGFVTDLRIIDPDTYEPLGVGFDENERDAPTAEDMRKAAAALRQMDAVQAETVFGEVFEAGAIVVAAGLSLDASTAVGAATVQGGRYGEPSSEGLWAALRALGAEYRETTVEVGPRVSARDAAAAGWLPADAGADVPGPAAERLVSVAGEGEAGSWPADYPPAPHWDRGLRIDWMVTGPVEGEHGEVGRAAPVLSPDGGATAELYVAPERARLSQPTDETNDTGEERALVATRMPLTAAGKVLTSLNESGRLAHRGRPGPVWVVGRAAGARDYAASLVSGVRAAAAIAEAFGLQLAGAELAGTPLGSPPSFEAGSAERDGGGVA